MQPLIETVEAKRGKVYPWTKVVEAHKEMEANKNSGKVGVQTQSRLLLMHQIRSSLRSRIKLFNPMHSVTIKRSLSSATHDSSAHGPDSSHHPNLLFLSILPFRCS